MFDCSSYHQEPGSEKRFDNLWLRFTHRSGLSLSAGLLSDPNRYAFFTVGGTIDSPDPAVWCYPSTY
jgi:hypothetical protein